MKIKVPVVLQMENAECGAACLAMLLAYNKKQVPLEKLRVDCGISRDGSNLKSICRAADFYGLIPRAFKTTAKGACQNLVLPAIIHWNFNHFVVLTGFDKNVVFINDPAVGTSKIGFDEFERSFTGIAVTFDKKDDFVCESQKTDFFGFITSKLSGTRSLLSYIFIAGLLLAVLNITAPVFARIFFDYVLFEKSPQWLMPLLAAMVLAAAASFVLRYIQAFFLLKLQGRVSVTSGSAFMWRLLKLPMEFFMSRFAGDISEKQSYNDEIAETICAKAVPAFFDATVLVLYFMILLSFDVTMTLMGIVIAAVNVFAVVYTSRANANSTRAAVRNSGKLASFAISGIEMIETIKSSGAENGYFEKLMGYSAKNYNTRCEIDKNNLLFGAIPSVMRELLNVFVLVFGVYKVLNGEFTMGILLAFQSFMMSFLGPIDGFLLLSSSLQETKSKLAHIDDIMHYPMRDDAEESIVQSQTKLSGAITVKNLNFSYNPLIAPLIEDFNLEIKKGEIIALVGGSGSGKSTIGKIIAGLLTPQSGNIFYDGMKREQISERAFCSSLATVDQKSTIFNDTVANNVTLWNGLISEQRIIKACKDAMLHQDIVKRTGGYENVLDASGRNMSRGQCQRLDIARALVTEPSILIMDEATSALDPSVEKAVMDNIIQRGITTIIIAHRLSAIRDADKILLLKNGKIVEQGTHSQLMEQKGQYAQLVLGE